MKDLSTFVDTLRTRELFEPGASLCVARAPGRLDVMGGIADYSGSLVLQRPIAEATFAVVQVIDQPVIEIVSLGRKPYTTNLASLKLLHYEDARKLFHRVEEDHWASYVAGAFIVLMRERGVIFRSGVKIVISSTVPEGKGVGSSAAIEVAAMQAVTAAFDIQLEPRETALLCQKVENLVAGAPCGVMDQMTAVFGEPDSLLALLCQPAELQSPVPLPEEISFWGLDSGERHAVSGSDYGSVRTGAFMGRRLIAERDASRDDYLANISPSDFEREFLPCLPEEMSGEAFLARYSGTVDTVTTVARDRIYKIRQPTAHPVYENDRVRRFGELLHAQPAEEQWTELGELLYQSHASYSACGLGSRGTDLLRDLVWAEGTKHGLYGARITGGGSGGTVAVLGRSDAGRAVANVAENYEKITGYRPHVFEGSSPGALQFGSVRVSF
jgi:galactokinase